MPESAQMSAVPPEPAAPAKEKGLLDDLVDTLFSPSAVFARRRSGYGGALMLLWVVTAVLLLIAAPVTKPIMQAEMDRAQARAAQQSGRTLTSDQAALASKIGSTIGTVASVVGPVIAMLVVGLGVWLFGRLFGGALSVAQGILISTFAFVPRVLGAVALVIQAYVLDASRLTSMTQVSISPARFLDPAISNPTITALLSRFDVFVLWSTVIIAAGYAVIAGMPKAKAWAAAVVLWAVAVLPTLWSAMRAAS
jgi:hypothetical protein